MDALDQKSLKFGIILKNHKFLKWTLITEFDLQAKVGPAWYCPSVARPAIY